MSDREKLPEWIDRFNEGTLRGEDLEKFIEMLKRNPKLRDEVNLDRELNQILEEDDLIEFRKKMLKATRSRRLPGQNLLLLAAMIIIIIGLFSLIYYSVRRSDPDHKNVATISDTSSIRNEKNRRVIAQDSLYPRPTPAGSPILKNKEEDGGSILLAQNFTPNPALESLLGTTTRNGYFKMIRPDNMAVFPKGGGILFEWKTLDTGPVGIVIVDNRGIKITDFKEELKNYKKVSTSQLRAGLYYYKLMIKDELVYIGKFIIE